MEKSPFNIPASSYIDALRRNKVDYFITVPDWIQLALHTRIEEGVAGMANITCANEDQAVCVSTGLRIAGKNPIVVVQNQGMFGCMNSVRAITIDARLPVVFLVGQFGREDANFGDNPSHSGRSMVRYLEPLLNVMDIRNWRLERTEDLTRMDAAFAYANETGRPAALLVGAPTAWE